MRIFGRILNRFCANFGLILDGFFGFFVGHNLLMTIDNLLMLKIFGGILPLLNYF